MPFGSRRPTSSLPYLILISLACYQPASARTPGIQDVSVKPGSFNPAQRQQTTLSFRLDQGGDLTVLVLDRDGFPVRRLAEKNVPAGPQALVWDGKNDAGVMVPDEAYSFRIDCKAAKGTFTYFPAEEPAAMYDARVTSYDRSEGVLVYTLPKPSRVHLQAGTAKVDPNGKVPPEGPVLKTVVDRQPRPAGSIVEAWDGFAESGDILVPELPNFVTGVACTPLPENAVITVGNRQSVFREYALKRTGKSLLKAKGEAHQHAGLTSLEDTSPKLTVRLNPKERGKPYSVTMDAPPNASQFVRLGGDIVVFVDGKRVLSQPAGATPMRLELPAKLTAGSHILAVNWSTGRGPTGVGTLRLDVPPPDSKEARR